MPRLGGLAVATLAAAACSGKPDPAGGSAAPAPGSAVAPAADAAVAVADDGDSEGEEDAIDRPPLRLANLAASPLGQGITAAVAVSDSTAMLFRKNQAVIQSLWTGAASEPIEMPYDVDAALRYDEDRVLAFSGPIAQLFDASTAEVVSTFPIAELGLPESWDAIDAAAVFAPGTWILFHGGEFLLYAVSDTGDNMVHGPASLASLGLPAWHDGIDAALNLLDGRIALFRGSGFMVLDADTATVDWPVSFESTAAVTP